MQGMLQTQQAKTQKLKETELIEQRLYIHEIKILTGTTESGTRLRLHLHTHARYKTDPSSGEY